MSKMTDKTFRKYLSMIRRVAVQSFTFMWLTASSFLIFMYMVHKFFPDHFLLFVVGFMTASTIMAGYLIKRIERMIRFVWDKV